MKYLLAILLCAGTAQAQYRYNLYTVSGTNASVSATNATTYNAAADVGPSSRADIQFVYKLTTNNAANLNQNVTATFDSSCDGNYYTNQFSISLAANSNNIVWMRTNVWVTNSAWLRLVSVTNGNAVAVTNMVIKVGNKIGL